MWSLQFSGTTLGHLLIVSLRDNHSAALPVMRKCKLCTGMSGKSSDLMSVYSADGKRIVAVDSDMMFDTMLLTCANDGFCMCSLKNATALISWPADVALSRFYPALVCFHFHLSQAILLSAVLSRTMQQSANSMRRLRVNIEL